MEERSSDTPPSGTSAAARLESWKEIAAYVKRDVTTVQRWEKREGMPIHRHLHDKRGSVYAFRSELDQWLQHRRLRFEDNEQEPVAETLVAVRSEVSLSETARIRRWLVFGSVVALALGLAYLFKENDGKKSAQPKITSLAVLPLKNLSGDPTQEFL